MAARRPSPSALEMAQLLVMRERGVTDRPAATDPRVLEVASRPFAQLRRQHALAVKVMTATTTREIRRGRYYR